MKRCSARPPNSAASRSAWASISGSSGTVAPRRRRGELGALAQLACAVVDRREHVLVGDQDADVAAEAETKVEPTRDGLRITLMDSAKRSMFVGATASMNDYGREMLGRIAFGDRELVDRALEAPALGPKWRDWLEGRRKRRPT